jgi:hypothetical protein
VAVGDGIDNTHVCPFAILTYSPARYRAWASSSLCGLLIPISMCTRHMRRGSPQICPSFDDYVEPGSGEWKAAGRGAPLTHRPRSRMIFRRYANTLLCLLVYLSTSYMPPLLPSCSKRMSTPIGVSQPVPHAPLSPAEACMMRRTAICAACGTLL